MATGDMIHPHDGINHYEKYGCTCLTQSISDRWTCLRCDTKGFTTCGIYHHQKYCKAKENRGGNNAVNR